MSDGISACKCTSEDEVVDLLQGGHGVFGIAFGRVWREVEGSCVPRNGYTWRPPRRVYRYL
jgi:hypothetical protein